jgi:hypothetical protein
MNYQAVDRRIEVQTATLAGGIGLNRGFSLWLQVPLVKSQRRTEWDIGEFGISLRWNPFQWTLPRQHQLYFNGGVIFPWKELTGKSTGVDVGVATLGQTLMRTSVEFWRFSSSDYTFGVQALWDLPVDPGAADFRYRDRVEQVTAYVVDQRFIPYRVIPRLSLSYRYDHRFKSAGTAGWFIQGLGALDIRLPHRFLATLSVGGPIVIGIEGADLSQTNVSVGLRFLPGNKQNPK